MGILGKDKEGEKVAGEVKECKEVIQKLSDEIKMLRKEVEFLTNLSKHNEEGIQKIDKDFDVIAGRFTHLSNILEIEEKDL